MRHRSSFRTAACALLVLAMSSSPIAVEAALAQSGGVSAISAADRKQGSDANPQLIQEYGGAITGPQASYVETVGKNIAVQSGLGNARGDFTVTLLNSPINNAFAIPGGYIYVTRQLVGLMNNEAELAGVLGHEVGHVAARHSAKRQSAAQRNTIFGALGAILSTAVLGNSALGQLGSQVFSTGSQLLTLKFSRAQETEADNLGVQYLGKAGYDPRAMSTVLQSLANQTALDAQLLGSNEAVPAWASTHPDPASRVRAALVQAGPAARGTTNRDVFLTRINGLMYGDDPAQGVVEGRRFTHPVFRMAFDAPAGFAMQNGTRSVAISGQSGKGEMSTAAYNGDMEAYVRAVFAGLSPEGQAAIAPASIERTTVNGIPASIGTARVTSGGSPVDVVVYAYEWSPSQAFHFVTISQAGQAGAFDPLFKSMRRISAAEAAAVRPRRISVVTVKSTDTLQSLAARMAYTDQPQQRFMVLNGLTGTARPPVGSKVKLVVY
ncbi:M48 family metalloprotease [Novosphingobium lentum]|uniref:M48 family metalloprotease n=1 Tax=Novosphingobium lentum TaxID=145287 RepID=UPI0008377A88|nr:M48 family metalloprotease [Novosphingobium lentum]